MSLIIKKKLNIRKKGMIFYVPCQKKNFFFERLYKQPNGQILTIKHFKYYKRGYKNNLKFNVK